ncbi:MAG TPA: hypothetical protein VFT52_03125 [Luteimonas sp.]|nr:hypothetical protein [Luteimonas sp.]
MRLSILIAGLALGGCASLHDSGWKGTDAAPFDGAKAACEAEAAAQPEGTARAEAFDACMAGKGWHRS